VFFEEILLALDSHKPQTEGLKGEKVAATKIPKIREDGTACVRRKTPSIHWMQEPAYEPLAALGLFGEEFRKMFFCARSLPRLPVVCY